MLLDIIGVLVGIILAAAIFYLGVVDATTTNEGA